MEEGDILLGTDEILLKATAVTDDGRESVRFAIDKGLAEMAKKIAKYGTGGEMTVKIKFGVEGKEHGAYEVSMLGTVDFKMPKASNSKSKMFVNKRAKFVADPPYTLFDEEKESK